MRSIIRLLITASILIAAFSASSMPAESASNILNCTVTDSCAGTVIFRMKKLSHAHAEIAAGANYDYAVCCSKAGAAIGTSCDTGYNILKLAKNTNSHAGKNIYNNYNVNVCISASNGALECEYLEGDCIDAGYDTCLASLYEDNNSNVADCTNPNLTRICCRSRCGDDECWNGQDCVFNQRTSPLAQPFNNSRCIDGEWAESELRFTADEEASGYCPKKSQCLLNVFGQNEESQCLESDNYVNDNYCENGIWSSRTKLIALNLLRMKSGDYTLFCDNRENTLNNLQYLTVSNEIVETKLEELDTNNFCILKAGGQIIAAASINEDLDEAPDSALDILGIEDCDFEKFENDGQYHPCDSTNKVWFNERLKSFIYSATPIPPELIPSEQDPLTSFEEFLGIPIKYIIDSLKRLITSPPFDESYLKGVKKFDKLYVTQQGSKSIIGTIEGTRFKNAVIEYRNFDTDICRLVEQFSETNEDISSGISCRKEGNTYYVLAQGSQFTSINPEQIWPDLTSKLRLK